MEVKFKEWNCVIKRAEYNNGRIALKLLNSRDGSPVAVATVNVPHIPLQDDEVIIKDYSENEGMLSALVTAGVVSEPIIWMPQGWVEVPVCKLLIKY